MGNITDIASFLLLGAIPILLAITLHEAAHGYVAFVFGDTTARDQGRMSLNPLRHIDPFGTVILPLMLMLFGGFIFGYAKPVPVNMRRLRNPKRDMIFVALAGPGANFVLAMVGAMLLPLSLQLPAYMGDFFAGNFQNLILFNCLLGIFNLLPVPPLDGGRVVSGLLPTHLSWKYDRIEPWGIFIVLGLFILLPMATRIIGLPINPFNLLVGQPTLFLYNFFLSLFM